MLSLVKHENKDMKINKEDYLNQTIFLLFMFLVTKADRNIQITRYF